MNASPQAATSDYLKSLRVAIVHYWFVGRAGGERVVEAIAEVFPQADIFTLILRPESLAPVLKQRKITTSFLQKLPFVNRFHRHFLFLQPLALEQFDLSGYDLVISSESGPAKGVLTSPKTLHICYCHSPMRYIWDMYPQYVSDMSKIVRAIFSLTAHYVRIWDYATASRVDEFVSNSQFVSARIRKFYGRESTVIHPPVDAEQASIGTVQEDFYLTVGRLVGYKRNDLAIEACKRMGRRLRIIGDGPEYKNLKRMAGSAVEFLGSASDAEVRENYSKCRALLFCGEEDFGIVPVEAQAYGKAVIAYGSGGVLETVRGLADERMGDAVEDPTGIFFYEQSAEALVDAMQRFEGNPQRFVPSKIRGHALGFDVAVFREKLTDFVLQSLAAHDAKMAGRRQKRESFA
jgi:glycosyltransferase involved in cell wall biosynthesis